MALLQELFENSTGKQARILITKDQLGKKTFKIIISGTPGYEVASKLGAKWYAKKFKGENVTTIKAVGLKNKADRTMIEKIGALMPDAKVVWVD